MGNYECKYCGCPYEYYSNKKHSSRKSCLVSKDKYHDFQNCILNNYQKLKKNINNSKK
jgi:hypothetical protein